MCVIIIFVSTMMLLPPIAYSGTSPAYVLPVTKFQYVNLMGKENHVLYSSIDTGSAQANATRVSPDRFPGGGGGGGGGGPTQVDVSFWIYNGTGIITVNGIVYQNGQTAALYTQTTYTIIWYQENGYYQFRQWESSAGSVGNGSNPSTTIYITSGGKLAAVENRTVLGPWTGYVASGSGIDAVSANLIVPKAYYVSNVGNASTSIETVSSWVGIGGDYYDGNLWQAGINIQYNGTLLSNPLLINAFYEMVGNNTTTSGGIPPYYLNHIDWQWSMSPGDSITMNVSIGANGYLYFSVVDHTKNKWFNDFNQTSDPVVSPINPALYNAVPDRHTAEWIVEVPGFNLVVSPQFTNTVFTSSSYSSGNMINPVRSGNSVYYWSLNFGGELVQNIIASAISYGNEFTVSYESSS